MTIPLEKIPLKPQEGFRRMIVSGYAVGGLFKSTDSSLVKVELASTLFYLIRPAGHDIDDFES
jgi:hypothetical protein